VDVDKVSLPASELRYTVVSNRGPTDSLEKMGPPGARLTMKELFPYMQRCQMNQHVRNGLTYPQEKPFEVGRHIDFDAR
jgi:hypothetical protein